MLAAGLAATVAAPDLFFGIRQSLGPVPHRHPTVLAREMTTLDHVTGGRAMLAFAGPFTHTVSEATIEAVALCRDMWREGIGVGRGPRYPAAGAVNRPLPQRAGGPPIALDLTDGPAPDRGAPRSLRSRARAGRRTAAGPPASGGRRLLDTRDRRLSLHGDVIGPHAHLDPHLALGPHGIGVHPQVLLRQRVDVGVGSVGRDVGHRSA